MKLFTTAMTGLVFVGMTVLALANPSMLPKHPGYPAGGEFANDKGQPNLTHGQSILDAAQSGDTNMTPTLMDPHNARLGHQGVGQLPTVHEPAIKKTKPSVKERRKMPSKQ